MPDMDAIAIAIAARYASGTLAPPADYGAIREATAHPPAGLAALPALIVYPDEGALEAGNQTRTGLHTFAARFYYAEAGDTSRDLAGILKWLTVLVDAHKASLQLGGLVAWCRTVGWKAGILTYADGRQYQGAELSISVRTSEPWAATA